MSKIISRTEAAARIGVSTHTLARWAKDPNNTVPKPIAWASSRKFYSEAEIACWLAERTRASRRRRTAGVDAHV